MTTPEQQAMLDACAVNLRVAAAQVSRRYQAYITYADMYQDGITWVLSHPGTVTARLEDGRRGSTRLTGQIAKHIDGIARREKAHACGYEPEDEAFYTAAMVEALLPAVWDTGYMDVPPPADGSEYQKQRSDPSTGGSWLAMTCDVRAAWDKTRMNDQWRDALTLRFRDGMRNYQVAERMGVADSTAQAYVGRGVRSLINALGGPAPSRCEPDCECMGGRAAQSNAQAVAETARGWDQ